MGARGVITAADAYERYRHHHGLPTVWEQVDGAVALGYGSVTHLGYLPSSVVDTLRDLGYDVVDASSIENRGYVITWAGR